MPNTARVAVVPSLGALLGVLGTGTSHPAPSMTGVADHVISTGRSAILRYWTTERMLHAQPPPEPPLPRTADIGAATAGAPETPPAGGGLAPPPGDGLGTPAGATVRRDAENSPGWPWTSPGAVRATTGKVFFTMKGGDFVCSAGTISGANRDLVVTAGHCVQDATGSWALNWIYVPGYDQGRRPYGVFTARHLFVPNAWSGRHDEDDDVAMVALATIDGRHVAEVVGAQSVAFDQPRGSVVYGFGYPTGGHFDGETLAYCSGRPHPDAHRITHDQGLRCDMAEGASGGPWLTRFDATTGTGVVTSVNSFKYSDDPDTMYGPYFSAAIRRVYDGAQHA